MQLAQKSMSFAEKLLKHYPITSQNECQPKCSHSQHNDFQPFQHMHDHRKEREIYDKPTDQKLQNMRYFKEMGNTCFKDKKYNQAAYFYQKAILYSDYTFPQQDAQIKEMEVLVQQSNMNLAICLVKQSKYSQALAYLREATKAQHAQKDGKLRKTVLNTRKKAYYWLAKYYIQAAEFPSASEQIELLSKLDEEVSSKQQAAELRRELSQSMKKYEKHAASLSKKMLDTSI